MAQILRATFQDVCAENLVVNSCLHFFSLSLFFFERGGEGILQCFLKGFLFWRFFHFGADSGQFPPRSLSFSVPFPFSGCGQVGSFRATRTSFGHFGAVDNVSEFRELRLARFGKSKQVESDHVFKIWRHASHWFWAIHLFHSLVCVVVIWFG